MYIYHQTKDDRFSYKTIYRTIKSKNRANLNYLLSTDYNLMTIKLEFVMEENVVERGEHASYLFSNPFRKSVSIIFNSIFVAFVEDNVTMSSITYFENRVSYFVQKRRR